MPHGLWRLRRAVLGRLGIEPGTGVLFSPHTRLRLYAALALSVLLAALEVLAVAAVLPLMQLLTGADVNSGVLGWILRLLGNPTLGGLAAWIGGFIFVIFLIKGILSIAIRWWIGGVLRDAQITTSRTLFDYYLRAPYQLYLRRGTADYVATMNDFVTTAYASVVASVIALITDGLSTIAIVVLLIVASPVPALVVIVFFAAMALLFRRWARPRSIAAGMRGMESARESFRAAVDPMASIKEVKVLHAREAFLEKYTAAQRKGADASRQMLFIGDLPKYVLEVLFVLGIAVLTVTVFAVQGDARGVGMIGLFAAAGFRLLPNVVRILGSFNAIESGRTALRAVAADVAAASELPTAETAAVAAMPLRRELIVDDVSFTYDGADEAVLQGVDLHVPAGSSLALVGSSGAGKTTLADVLLGLLIPTKGRVLADGVDIHTDLPSWQANLGMVPQEVYLFEATIAENIAYTIGRDGIDENRVWRALERAEIADFVRALPDGLWTVCGEERGRFSGGQRQRFGLARALYRNPAVLVLDEATSALDNETERRITDTMNSVHGTTTVIVIAHRLSTVRHCDQIAYLDNGVVVDRGTFDELCATNARFAQLVELGRL